MTELSACAKSECDLFEHAPVQTTILGDNTITLKPVASLDNNTQLEFFYGGGAADMYLDLSRTYLRLKLSISKSGSTVGTPTAPSAPEWKTGFVNNILFSLFSQCEVYINETNITTSTSDYYNYKCMIQNLLNYSPEAGSSHLYSAGFALDIKSDGTSDGLLATTDNKGWEKRLEPFKDGKAVVLHSRIQGDIFDQPKLIPAGCDFRLRLVFADSDFYLYTNVDNSETKLSLLDASLFMRQVQVNPSTVIAHNRVLAKRNAVFPMKRSEIKTYSIPRDVNGFNLHNVYTGVLPDLLVIGFVEQDAFHGTIKKNPYHFKDMGLTSLSVYVNGLERKIEDFKFGTTGNWAAAYSAFYEGIGIHRMNEGRMITYDMFGHNYTLFAFDLTPDGSGHTQHTSVKQIGNIRIHGNMITLPATMTCVVYAEFSSVMEIDNYRKPVVL